MVQSTNVPTRDIRRCQSLVERERGLVIDLHMPVSVNVLLV